MEVKTEEMPIMQKEGIKLVYNTKGVFWEIKVLDLDVDNLEKIHQKMTDKFGQLT